MLQFEKYSEYSQGILSGSQNDAFGVGTVIAAGLQMLSNIITGHFNKLQNDATNIANAAIANQTNQTNAMIAHDTNLANKAMTVQTNQTNLQIARETNEMQIAESEKAYQRSTATNQINELVKAGFSEQQAKQIVGSSGSAAAYPPAALTAAQMVAPTAEGFTAIGPTAQRFQMDPIQGFSELGQGLETLGTDFMRADGGFIGAAIAEPALNDLSANMDKLDEDFWSSPESAQAYYRDENWRQSNPWFTDKMEKHLDRVFHSVQGTRTFMQQGEKVYNSYNLRNQVKSGSIEIQKQLIDLRIKRATESAEIVKSQNEAQLSQYETTLKGFEVKLAPKTFLVRQEELNVAFRQAQMELKQLKNPHYRALWFANNLSNLEALTALNDSKKVHAQYAKLIGDEKVAFAEKFSPWIATWEIFDDAGLTKTNAGAVIAALFGTAQFGINNKDEIISGIRQLFDVDSNDKIKKQYDEQVKTAYESLVETSKSHDPTSKLDPFKK